MRRLREKTGPAAVAKALNSKTEAEDLVAGDGYIWVAMEDMDGYIAGEQVEPKIGDTRVGDRMLLSLDSGAIMAAKRLSIDAAFAEQAALVSDARVMSPLMYDNDGKRHREFGEAVRGMKQEISEDFPLRGDRTTAWLLRYIAEHGGTPDGRQTKWASEQKIDKDSAAYIVHDLCGLSLELAATWDQVDATNLASLEVVARLYQLTEETSGSMKIEGFEHFVGRDVSGSSRRGVALSPGIAKHTTDKLAQQTAILKERRKAREELASSKAVNKPKG